MKRITSMLVLVAFLFVTFGSQVAVAFEEEDEKSYNITDFDFLEEYGISGYVFENGVLKYVDMDGNLFERPQTYGAVAIPVIGAVVTVLGILGIKFASSMSKIDITNAVNDMFTAIPQVFDIFTNLIQAGNPALMLSRSTLNIIYNLVKGYFDFDTPAMETTPDIELPSVGGSQISGMDASAAGLSGRPNGFSHKTVKMSQLYPYGSKYKEKIEITINAKFSSGKFIGYDGSMKTYSRDVSGLILSFKTLDETILISSDTYPLEPQFYLQRSYDLSSWKDYFSGYLNSTRCSPSSFLVSPRPSTNFDSYKYVYNVNTTRVNYLSGSMTKPDGRVSPDDVLDAWGTVAGGSDIALEVPLNPSLDDSYSLAQKDALPPLVKDKIDANAGSGGSNPDKPDEKPSVPPPGPGFDFGNLSDLPNREDFADGWLGDIQYGLSSLLYWILYPFRLIGSLLAYIVKTLVDLVSQMKGFMDFLASNFLPFLPKEVLSILILAFVALIALRFLGR